MHSDVASIASAQSARWRVLLLMADRQEIDDIRALLRPYGSSVDVEVAASLHEAIVFDTPDALHLIVVDPSLCDGLEREFVQHLLAAPAALQVVLLDDGSGSALGLRAERLDCVPRSRLLATVREWAQRHTAQAVS